MISDLLCLEAVLQLTTFVSCRAFSINSLVVLVGVTSTISVFELTREDDVTAS